MKLITTLVKLLLILIVLSGILFFFFQHQASPLSASPCEKPVTYSILSVDTRFPITNEQFVADVESAAALWNDTTGIPLLKKAETETEDTVRVSLVYSEHQTRTELGGVISKQQEQYDAKRDEIEVLKLSFASLQTELEKINSAFERKAAAYQNEVSSWNAQGGAPEEVYERMQNTRQALENEQEIINKKIEKLNTTADALNTAIEELNVLADEINKKAGIFNQGAGMDFHQGRYEESNAGKTITVYSFENREELRRVLAHEFGHALGLDHTEDSNSLMYTHNLGGNLVLTEADGIELARVCGW